MQILINFAFFCPALIYSTFILLKIALKNFKRMQLVHLSVYFFCFSNLFFKPFFLSWFKNLRAQFRLYRKKAVVPPKKKKRLCVCREFGLIMEEGFLYQLNMFFTWFYIQASRYIDKLLVPFSIRINRTIALSHYPGYHFPLFISPFLSFFQYSATPLNYSCTSFVFFRGFSVPIVNFLNVFNVLIRFVYVFSSQLLIDCIYSWFELQIH